MKKQSTRASLSLLVIGLLLQASPARAWWGPEKIKEGWEIIAEVQDQPIATKHEKLMGIIGGMGSTAAFGEPPKHKGSLSRNQEQEALFRAARDLLTSTPGHAEYYGDKIREWKQQAETYPEPAYTNYVSNRVYAIQVLSALPSPETARVMAGFLDDIDTKLNSEGMPYGNPNAVEAARVLISILDPPPINDFGPTAVWLQWRKEVEAGQTTFHLKGIEGEFNFKGPVTPKATRIPKTGTASDPHTHLIADSKNTSADQNPTSAPAKRWIWIALAALLASVIYLVVAKKRT